MSESGFGLRRAGGERAVAWLLTGPLGHLYAFLADVSVLWVRWAAAVARQRVKRMRLGAPAGPERRGSA